MAEYIEREALLAEIANMTIVPDDLYDYGIMAGVDAVKKKVAEAPAVDVETVVRCKDCWSAIEIDGFMGGVLYCKFWGHDIEEECFCSYGERKEIKEEKK